MTKTKTFISIIPFQGKDMLKAVTYPPHGNSRLQYGETRFPIIPVINGYAQEGDAIRIIVILTDGENFQHNYNTYFVPEVEALVEKKNLQLTGFEIIRTPDREDIDTQLRLFRDINDKIRDNEELYACITYGTKPTPIIESMALNYAVQNKTNTTVGCIVYGRYFHDDINCNNGIYDTTALFRMDRIVNELAKKKVKNPERAIRLMLDFALEQDGDDNE